MLAHGIQTFGGQLLAGLGGGAVAAITIVKFFGERWLDTRSAQRAAAEKHARDREIEALRDHISRQFDRVTKLSQREFDVLPEIWLKLVDAFSAVENVSIKLRHRVDLAKIPDDEARKHLEGFDIPSSVADQIIAAEGWDRNKRYWRILDRIEAGNARTAAAEAHFALARLGIFLPETLFAQLNELKEFIWSAAVDHEMQVEDRDGPPVVIPDRPVDNFRMLGRAKLAAGEKVVRDRLRSGVDQ